MTKPTDEMRAAAYRVAREWAVQHRHALPDDRMLDVVMAAVLAIAERDSARPGPCSSTLPRLTEYGDLWCQLRHGHAGDHEMGPTRWKERP